MTRSRKDTPKPELTRNPLFQRWISDFPDLTAHIHEKEWAGFFQYIILALAGKRTERLYRFLDFYLPRLIRNDIPSKRVLESLTSLRALFLAEIPQSLSVEKRDRVAGQILDHFDSVLLFTQEKFLRCAEPEMNYLNHHHEGQLAKLKTMAFHVRGRRFSGQGYQNPAFHQWTDTDPSEHIARAVWEVIIHPDDYLVLQSRLREMIESQQAIYELNYRLKNHKGDWEHVVELGRILYDESRRVEAFIGVITVASASSQHLIQDFELANIFRFLLDDQKDLAMLLDMEGRILFATPRLNPYLKTENNIDLALTDHIFFDLLDRDNKIVARRSWEQFLEHPQDGRKMLLKLRDRNKQTRIIEFSYQSVYSSFKKKLICLSGKAIAKRSSSEVYLEQSSTLLNLFMDNESPEKQQYQKMLDIALKLIPGAQFATLLQKNHLGYIFTAGVGFETAPLQDLVLLDKTTVRKLKSLDEISGIDDTVKRITMREVREELYSALPEARRELILNQGRIASANELLAGKIFVRGESHSLIVLGTVGEENHFTENDLFLLQLLTKQASLLLGHSILGKDLIEATRNYSQLLQHAPVACFVIQDNRIQSFNPFFKDMLGYGRDEMLVRDLWRHLHPDDLQRFQMDIAAVTDRYSVMDMEIRLIDKQKQELFCNGTLLNVQLNGQPAVLCIAFDQSKVKVLEEQLSAQNRGEADSAMLAGIAHDFNNILGTVIPASQLIMKRPRSSKTHNRAKIIFMMAQRAYQMNQGLLKLPERESKEGLEKVDITMLMRDNHKTFRRILGESVKLEYDLTDKPMPIEGDYKQLVQALINLLINAREAMPEGGIVTVGCSTQQIKEQDGTSGEFHTVEHVVISIQDTGRGVPADIRTKIYDPFFTTKPKGRGAGLGLSIVQRIVKHHHGSILLNGNGTGTTFKISLPLLQEKKPDILTKNGSNGTATNSNGKAATNGTVPKNGTPAGKILVVDDEQYLREVFVSMLKLNGYGCFEASSGAQAIALYTQRQDEIDLIILDYAMPGMSGAEVYKKLKEINPKARIMLCTGYADQKEISGFINNGEMEYLPKPFTIEILSKKVKRALKPRRTLQQNKDREQ
ncbi:MAG: response regulator [Calditrichia bacterium]